MLVSKLAEENASLVSFSRDDIISALSLYRDGSVEDRAFQAKLFDAFLVAVYLYEDHFKLEFHVGGKSGIDVPLEPSVVEELGEAECSYRLAFEPPSKKAVKSLISRLFCVFGRFQFLPEKCRTVAFAPQIIRIHLARRKSENSGGNRSFSEKRFLRVNNAILGETEPFASKRIHQNDSHPLCILFPVLMLKKLQSVF